VTRLYMTRDKKFVDPDLLPHGCGLNKKYKYRISLNDYGVGYDLIVWCAKHCKSKWGWYFKPLQNVPYNLDIFADEYDYDKQMAFLSFKSKKDAVYFMLTHGPNNSKRT
jgi:hypothetical protein